MKFANALVYASAVAVTNAFSADFFQGLQTGLFITDVEQFNDYSCPEVEVTPAVKNFLNMIEPAKMMIQNMNQGKSNPTLDSIASSSQQVGRIISLFSEFYDGGEFCQGVILAYEVGSILMKYVRPIFDNLKNSGAIPKELADNPIIANFLQ